MHRINRECVGVNDGQLAAVGVRDHEFVPPAHGDHQSRAEGEREPMSRGAVNSFQFDEGQPS